MRNRKEGFTLIELLIVIAIIGILAAVLIPNLLDARRRAFDTGAQSCLKELATLQEVYLIDNNEYGDKAALEATGNIPGACGSLGDDGDEWTATNADVDGENSYIMTASHGNSNNTYEVTPGQPVALQGAP